jgi:hypothetical protein
MIMSNKSSREPERFSPKVVPTAELREHEVRDASTFAHDALRKEHIAEPRLFVFAKSYAPPQESLPASSVVEAVANNAYPPELRAEYIAAAGTAALAQVQPESVVAAAPQPPAEADPVSEVDQLAANADMEWNATDNTHLQDYIQAISEPSPTIAAPEENIDWSKFDQSQFEAFSRKAVDEARLQFEEPLSEDGNALTS